MKKNMIYIAVTLTVLALAACSKSEDVRPQQVLKIAGVTVEMPALSRASTPYTAGSVGLFVSGNDNVKVSYSGGAWTTESAVTVSAGATTIPVIAYAPYSSSVGETLSLSVAADQSSSSYVSSNENGALYFNGNATMSGGAVTINLNRALSKLTLKLTRAGVVAGATVESVTVGGLKLAGSLTLESGEISASGTASDVAVSTSAVTATDGASILIVPQTAKPVIEVKLKTASNEEYVTTCSFDADQSFAAGKAYELTVAATKGAFASELQLMATETEW